MRWMDAGMRIGLGALLSVFMAGSLNAQTLSQKVSPPPPPKAKSTKSAAKSKRAKAKAKGAYVKFVKPIAQNKIKSPVRKDKKKVYEGCGPVAGAMLLGYWQTERGQKNLLAKGYTGTKHPSKAIRKLYQEMKSKKAPGKKRKMSYTMPDSLFKALKKRAKKGKKIQANRMRKIRKWKKRKAALKAQLKKGNPVILLKNKEHKDGCLGKTSEGKNLFKNLANSHYFVAVGFKGKKVAVMPGWREKDKSTSSGFGVHKQNNRAHDLCTFSELKEANVSLFWIEKE